jgi:hypothetical protein
MSTVAPVSRTIFAGALALILALVGILPLADTYRCVSMGRIMTSHPCCAADQTAEARIDRTCCERLPARAQEVRASSVAPDLRIAPASLSGVLQFPSLAIPSPGAWVVAAAHADGRPPGERLHQLSSILRI